MVRRCAPLLFALALAAPAAAQDLPDLGQGRPLEDGVVCYEVVLPREDAQTTLWIYRPKASKPKRKLPCVLIAPAGTPLFHGMALADGDRPEHLPYVKAGFAVVAYSVSGAVSEGMSEEQFVAAVRAFVAARGGVADAKAAVDYVLAKVPAIDPARIYAAGHSSAATLALQVAAAAGKGIAGCVAYAPCAFVPERVGAKAIQQLEAAAPGSRALLERRSPHEQTARLTRPLFLFHAEDDENVPANDTRRFADLVKKTNDEVRLEIVPSGGHYESMIKAGIPSAIRWLKNLDR